GRDERDRRLRVRVDPVAHRGADGRQRARGRQRAGRVRVRRRGSSGRPPPGAAADPDGHAVRRRAGCGGSDGSFFGRGGRGSVRGVRVRGGGGGGDAGVRRFGVSVLSDGTGDACGDGGVHPEGGARVLVRADGVRGGVRGRARGGLQRGLHSVVFRRGVHGGVRGREFLSWGGAHAWADGGVEIAGGGRAVVRAAAVRVDASVRRRGVSADAGVAVRGLDWGAVGGGDHGGVRGERFLSRRRDPESADGHVLGAGV